MRRYVSDELVLGNILEQTTTAHPAKTFLKFPGGEFTYGEVSENTNRLMHGLAAIGIRQNDHVAIMLPNCPDFVFAAFALAKLGAVAVPVNLGLKGNFLHHVLNTSDVSVLIVDESYIIPVAEVADRLPRLELVIMRTQGASLESIRAIPKASVPLEWLRGRRGGAPRARVRHCDLQAIMYTSGTTGPSKGVMVTHAHALMDAEDSMHLVDYRPDETIYCPLPLFHAGALWDGLMTALLAGCSIAIVERFSASRFWDDVRRFRANVAMGIFSMVPILLKKSPTPEDKNHTLRALYLGKSALDDTFYARFGVRLVESYTSTEIGVGTCSPYGQWRTGSCGQTNDTTHEVKLVTEDDREVQPGEPGEFVVRPKRPYAMMLGYYNSPSATTSAFRNLWFHTGDRGYRDEDGYFYFIDRIKDCIRRRGENISAFEVEQAVNEHPAVLESAAYAVPSDIEEDDVKLTVVRVPGTPLDADELIAFCEEHLPPFMVPKYVDFIDELPKSAIGKVAKHVLREEARRTIALDIEKKSSAPAAGCLATPAEHPQRQS